MGRRFYFSDSEETNVAEIGIGVVCRHARFVFDKPLTLQLDEVIELDNGQFFLVKVVDGKEKRTLLNGKWDR